MKIPPTNSPFYNQVMAYKPHSRHTGEGMFITREDPVKNPLKIGFRDFMKVFLETDAGDKEEQRQSFYEKHLKTLNRSELTRLMKKIHKIAATLIEDSDEFIEMKKLAEETIEPILAESAKLTETLHKKILKQLKKFPGLKFYGNNQVEYSKRKFTLQGFVKEYFTEIADEYDHLVKKGLLIPDRSEKLGTTFVKHAIQSEQAEQ